MIYIHLILSGVGSLTNYVYFRKNKTSYRWIKLSYTVNLFLIFMINLSAVLTGQTELHYLLEGTIITLLLATIIGGSFASAARAGITLFPDLKFKIRIERED